MVNYTIVNTTSATFANVNAGNYDIPGKSIASGIALDTTELAAVVALAGAVVIKDALTRNQYRVLARGLKYLPKVVAGTS